MKLPTCLALGLIALAPAASRSKVADGAPYCAVPNTPALFVAPMGEPFRAAAGQAYPAAGWFAAAVRDHDGAVDRTEFDRDADRFFKLLDIDHDGRLTPEEVDRYERTVAPEIALYSARREIEPPSRRPGSGESGYGGAMGAGRYAWLNIPEPVASADLDVNRIGDEKEFAAAAGRRFGQLAPNGRLILAALPKTPQQTAIEGPCRPRPKPRKGRGPDGRGEDDRDGDLPRDRDGRDGRP